MPELLWDTSLVASHTLSAHTATEDSQQRSDAACAQLFLMNQIQQIVSTRAGTTFHDRKHYQAALDAHLLKYDAGRSVKGVEGEAPQRQCCGQQLANLLGRQRRCEGHLDWHSCKCTSVFGRPYQ